MTGFEERLVRLEAESAIRQLVARYCFMIDDRHLDGIAALFDADAVVRSADGVMHARGLDAIMAQYRRRFEVLGPGQHVMHDLVIEFTGPDEARGRVSGHAELWRGERMMIAALRYDDVYRATAAGWRFADRLISFLYYVPLEEYPGILGVRDRNRAYEKPMSADFPEALPSWTAYERSGG